MLAIGPRFSPNDRPGLITDRLAVAIYAFTVALHIPLLKIRRKSVHVLVIRDDSFGFCSEKIVVPYANQRKRYRDIILHRSFPEMGIHFVESLQKVKKVIRPNSAHDWQANRSGNAVSSPYPIPEYKHIAPVNPKLGDFFFIGGNGYEVPG